MSPDLFAPIWPGAGAGGLGIVNTATRVAAGAVTIAPRAPRPAIHVTMADGAARRDAPDNHAVMRSTDARPHRDSH